MDLVVTLRELLQARGKLLREKCHLGVRVRVRVGVGVGVQVRVRVRVGVGVRVMVRVTVSSERSATLGSE